MPAKVGTTLVVRSHQARLKCREQTSKVKGSVASCQTRLWAGGPKVALENV